MLKVISLGAGVQSSTLFLMSCLGEIDKADVAIFADTQGEPPEVYKHLDYLSGIGEQYGIPVYRVSKGDLLGDFMEFVDGDKKRASMIPLMTMDPETGYSGGLLGRHCTYDYKVMPIRAKTRQLLKERGEKKAEMWIGISVDEVQRMKDSRVQFIEHVWPLIDKRISRQDCLQWYNSHDFPTPPRSACYYCPFHNNTEWRRVRDETPDLWDKAIEIDKRVRRFGKVRFDNYLHKDRVPLDEAQLDEDENQIDLFGAECEGMCGI
jgi:hypothetical protein